MDLETSANAALGGGDESNPLTSPLVRKLDISEVVIHPLVLLSVADHYHRVARGTRKRVVGVLLGQVLPGGKVDATNSYAVPFEEDTKNPVRNAANCSCANESSCVMYHTNETERYRPRDVTGRLLLGP
jgi:JAB1/Mov34/MPN/PAD-1 ubiquitin protease